MSNTQNLIKFARNLTATKQLNFVGPVNISTGITRWYPDVNILIDSVTISSGIAPVSSSLTFVIKKSGTIISTVSLSSGLNISSPITINVPVTTAEYITVDVTSTGGASDAVLSFIYKRN